jgi:hypothetical protein|tara:strand:+ start:616 stop:1164 length:549 start_codon:yes stop_codon:yes gene_type:complete
MEEILNVIPNREENYTCSICLDENIEEEDISTTNCSHSFCNKCLEDWLNKGKYSCPLCRNEIKTFITNDKETRILPIQVRSNTPMINNIPVTTIIRNLVNSNILLKYGLCLTLSILAITSNYYIRNLYSYSNLLNKYEDCNINLTIYQGMYHDLTEVALYDTAYHSLEICKIPQYYYNKCFY